MAVPTPVTTSEKVTRKTTLFAAVSSFSGFRVLSPAQRLVSAYWSQDGAPYRIPGEFVCSAPFGWESLQVVAAAAPFPVLETRVVDGYPVIAEDEPALMRKTRGFKPAAGAAVESCELAITTLAR
ncbi:MAG: hypothetical protein H0W72_09785 [Planctomycetes bacterium]|nr:hypothetical protein [Planctomycetota bacterium]